MQADDYSVEEILRETRRFMVPIYQRKYQWMDERLLPFWEDVEAKAVEVLDGTSKFQHYMGALILAPIGDPAQIAKTPKVQVVDGQQRLTTFQIFLAALKDVAKSRDVEHLIQDIDGYVFNQRKAKDKDPLTRFKLTPTPSDRDVFHHIIGNSFDEIKGKYRDQWWGGNVKKSTNWPALRAYDLFRARIESFGTYGPTEPMGDSSAIEAPKTDGADPIQDETDTQAAFEERLEAILRALLSRLKLVVISLGEDDDAQVIFETLNSKGQPLLAMDLVRNNIFHRAEREGAEVEALYKRLWDPFDQPWWLENAPFARPKRPRIDHFLAHALAAETGERISMRELYAEYRAYSVPKGRPRFSRVEDELRVLEHHAPLYETLEGRADVDARLSWLGKKLRTWQVTTAYPIAMQLCGTEVPREDRDRTMNLIYSYIVRRALCGLTTKNLNRVFQSLAHEFATNGPSKEVFVQYFEQRTGDSTRFPGNDELRRGVLESPAYYRASDMRVKDVLWELEIASRSQFSESTDMPSGLWTEHVMPVSWNENWPFDEGVFVSRDSEDPRAAHRNNLVHTLGNLTLLTSGLNISSGNQSFLDKREKYREHSTLFLNRWFLERSRWTETEIYERGKRLGDLATKVWPALPAT